MGITTTGDAKILADGIDVTLAQPEPCANESDCDYMPWCRIRNACQKQARAVEQIKGMAQQQRHRGGGF